jgi:hypothetical protein
VLIAHSPSFGTNGEGLSYAHFAKCSDKIMSGNWDKPQQPTTLFADSHLIFLLVAWRANNQEDSNVDTIRQGTTHGPPLALCQPTPVGDF